MKAVSAVLLSVSVLALGACSAEPGSSVHDHGGAHASIATLEQTLLTPADLPAGYISGAHHESPEGQPGVVAPVCEPLAAVLHLHGAGHEGHGSEHPRVSATFSKSHFGPQITHGVVDLGTVDAARTALEDMRDVRVGCQRYEHSTSPIGANSYRVSEGPRLAATGGAVSVRLVALGDDFEGINWDVWTTRHGARLITVAFRSARGGDSADLAPAARAALQRQS